MFNKLSCVISDRSALNILYKAVAVENKGIPQGLSISNILSSIYMKKLDENYTSKLDISYYRYVDDILNLCNDSNINSVIKLIKKDTEKLKLTIHSFEDKNDKSLIGDISNDSFQYLGYEFYNNKLSVRKESIKKFQERVINIFTSSKKDKLSKLYENINLKITGCVYNNKQYGWMHFFGLIDDLELLYKLDWFIKKCFKQFNRRYDEAKIKKFSKVYFQLKNFDINKYEKNSYIPNFDINQDFRISYKKIKELKEDSIFY